MATATKTRAKKLTKLTDHRGYVAATEHVDELSREQADLQQQFAEAESEAKRLEAQQGSDQRGLGGKAAAVFRKVVGADNVHLGPTVEEVEAARKRADGLSEELEITNLAVHEQGVIQQRLRVIASEEVCASKVASWQTAMRGIGDTAVALLEAIDHERRFRMSIEADDTIVCGPIDETRAPHQQMVWACVQWCRENGEFLPSQADAVERMARQFDI